VPERVRSYTSQGSAINCIHEPISETTWAVKYLR
jgi:hypothetical protein